jgi:hypothetical protein
MTSNSIAALRNTDRALQTCAYSSLLTLIERIAYDSDVDARDELHGRRRPCRWDGQFVSIATFLEGRAERARYAWTEDVVECARDLTFDKFWQMPDEGSRAARGTDCRGYFTAVAAHCRSITSEHDELEREVMVADALRSFILRHFLFSLREASRQSRRRRDVEATAGALHAQHLSGDPRALGLPWSVEYGLSVYGLAEVVAREKAVNLDSQRPAIRTLGRELVAQLVRAVFNELAVDDLNLTRIAKRFKLNPATLTRFAGIRWRAGNGNVPDLWANTARVLGRSPRFREAAEAAGVWPGIQLAQKGDAPGGRYE